MKSRNIWGCLLVFCLVTFSISAQDESLKIVASHSILGDVVQNVVGDTAQVQITMSVGTDPHSFQPVPSDLTQLADADIVFVNGAGFEEGLLESIENAGTDMTIVEVSSCVPMLTFDDELHHDHDDEHEEHEDEDEHEDHKHEDHDDEHEDHNESFEPACNQHNQDLADLSISEIVLDGSVGALYEADCGDFGCDPHVWMQPYYVMLWTLYIRDSLMTIDPNNQAIYEANATAYIQALQDLMTDMIDPAIARIPSENRILVTNHDSLQYFAASYGFEIAQTIILGGSTVGEPSTSDIVTVIERIREDNISTIFSETSMSDDIIRQIANETGTQIITLYSGSLGDADSPASTYIDYMIHNVTAIADALGINQ